MEQKVNEKYAPLFTERPRYFLLIGGRGAGRSTVASQYANAKLVAPEYFRCAIMRYILGDIRNSIYREIIDRAEENGIRDSLEIADNSMTIKYGVNTINAVGFRKSSGDQKSKLKSLANYNCVIIEEGDEIGEEEFTQLDDSLRTMKGDITIILLLNPPARTHWIIQKWFDLEPSGIPGFYVPKLKPDIKDTVFVHTTFEDNLANLSPQTVHNYEAYKETKPAHYYNMVRGLVPEVVRGRIYSDWKLIDEVPHEARLERYGLDFGYSVDPTAIVAVYYYNGGYILDEIAYRKELQNRHIADILLNQPKALIIADSAEPKSIAEIKEYGLDIVGTEKGRDSVRHGIQNVQQRRISVTRRSRNLWWCYENFHWKEDKDGNSLNEPDHIGKDGMDAVSYGLSGIIGSDPLRELQTKREIHSQRQDTLANAKSDAGL